MVDVALYFLPLFIGSVLFGVVVGRASSDPSKPIAVEQPSLEERLAAAMQRLKWLETELYMLKNALYWHRHDAVGDAEGEDEPEAEPEIELEREARE